MQTKLDAQCDRPATQLSWQSARQSMFSRYSEWFVKSCQFWPMPPAFDVSVWVLPRSSSSENWSQCLCDLTFGRFSKTPTCDRQTDRHTDRHTTIAFTVLAWHCAVKAKLSRMSFYTRLLKSQIVSTTYIHTSFILCRCNTWLIFCSNCLACFYHPLLYAGMLGLGLGLKANFLGLGLGLGSHGLGLEDFGLGLDLGLATLVLASWLWPCPWVALQGQCHYQLQSCNFMSSHSQHYMLMIPEFNANNLLLRRQLQLYNCARWFPLLQTEKSGAYPDWSGLGLVLDTLALALRFRP